MFSRKHFPAQERAEKMALLLRRHWLVALGIYIRFAIIAAIPIGVYYFAEYYFPGWRQDNEYFGLAVLLVSLYYLGVWLFFFNAWIDYYLDTWIVTNLKVISIDQKNLFRREISRMLLNEIQDVSSQSHGFFPTLFNYGDVTIQSAGAVERFFLRQVPDPDKVTRIILDLSHQAKAQPPHAHPTV